MARAVSRQGLGVAGGNVLLALLYENYGDIFPIYQRIKQGVPMTI